MDKVISTSSYTVSGVTAAGGMLSLNSLAIIIGIIFALLTFLVNWAYQHRKFRIAEGLAEHERAFQQARMAKLQEADCLVSADVDHGEA